MPQSLLECSPKQMLGLGAPELRRAIELSRGRTVIALARTRGSNYLQYVTNAEMCAKFGADIVYMDTYDPKSPQFVGLPSKEPDYDERYRDIQIQAGRGWTAREVRELVGRPLGVTFFPALPAYGGHTIDTAFNDDSGVTVAGCPLNDWDDFELMVEQGFDIIFIEGWCDPAVLVAAAREAVSRAGGRVLIEAGVPHGPGLILADEEPLNLRELMTPELVRDLADAGVDIVDIPAAGSLPGFSVDYVSELIDVAHRHGALVQVGLHNSQEGTDAQTARRIAIDNRIAGADMFMIGDAGINENMGLPETINSLCVAVKGRANTIRRMSESAAH